MKTLVSGTSLSMTNVPVVGGASGATIGEGCAGFGAVGLAAEDEAGAAVSGVRAGFGAAIGAGPRVGSSLDGRDMKKSTPPITTNPAATMTSTRFFTTTPAPAGPASRHFIENPLYSPRTAVYTRSKCIKTCTECG